jgi:hypothetical protein
MNAIQTFVSQTALQCVRRSKLLRNQNCILFGSNKFSKTLTSVQQCCQNKTRAGDCQMKIKWKLISSSVVRKLKMHFASKLNLVEATEPDIEYRCSCCCNIYFSYLPLLLKNSNSITSN